MGGAGFQRSDAGAGVGFLSGNNWSLVELVAGGEISFRVADDNDGDVLKPSTKVFFSSSSSGTGVCSSSV